MFLQPVPEWSAQFPYVFLWTVDDPTFWSLLSLSLGAMRRVLMVLLPLKCTWILKLLDIFLNLFPSLWMYSMYGFCYLIHCCCFCCSCSYWDDYQWLFVHCGCCVYGWTCVVECWEAMVGSCKSVGLPWCAPFSCVVLVDQCRPPWP